MICRENYEAYLLDYLEGNLEESAVNEFIEFLKKNPLLQEELKNYKKISLKTDLKQFPYKNLLYKNKFDLPDKFEKTAVAYIENDLSDNEKKNFISFIDNNPDKKKELQLFTKTKLNADKSIICADKSGLYKKYNKNNVFFFAARIAAAIILLFLATDLTDQKISGISENMFTSSENNPVANNPLIPAGQLKFMPQNNSAIYIFSEEILSENKLQLIPENRIFVFFKKEPVPQKMASMLPRVTSTEALFAVNDIIILEFHSLDIEEDMLLAEKIIKKSGIENIEVKKIKNAGLRFISKISSNRFNYTTNNEGDVTALALETGFLGISIPVNKK